MFFKVSILSVHTIILTLVLFLVNPENHKIAKFSVDIALKLWQYWKKPKRLHILRRSQKCEICNFENHKNCSSDKSCSSLGAAVQVQVPPSPFSSVLMIQNWTLYWWSNIDADNSDFGEFQNRIQRFSWYMCLYKLRFI